MSDEVHSASVWTTQASKEPRPVRLRRSVLFMPASNARALEKARGLACDAVILDLEDAVAPEAKELARTQAVAAIKSFGAREVILRINALSSPWGQADLAAATIAGPDAILLPKVGAPSDLLEARHRIPVGIALWANVETAQGILQAPAIAAAGAECLLLGANDLMKDLHTPARSDRRNLWTAMSLLLLAARAQGLDVLDGTYNAINNAAGFAADCELGREFGFDGKALIHPSQIETCNRIFSPSPDAVAEARAILAAFAAQPGKGAIRLDGRMVERLHADSAAKLVARADAIAAQRA